MAGSKKKNRVLVAKSRAGLNHLFDVEGIEELAEAFVAKSEGKFKSQVVNGASFWSWLQSKSTLAAINPKNCVQQFSGSCFRATTGQFNPLDVAGNLAAGGRFSVGGAQIQSKILFPKLDMRAGLYAADSADCARAEMQTGNLPAPHAKISELKTKRPLVLWTLDKVLAALARPELQQLVDETPMDAIWALQKVPRESQLLGAHLRLIGGDGIAYRSLRHPGGTVFCFFVDNQDHAKELFDAI